MSHRWCLCPTVGFVSYSFSLEILVAKNVDEGHKTRFPKIFLVPVNLRDRNDDNDDDIDDNGFSLVDDDDEEKMMMTLSLLSPLMVMVIIDEDRDDDDRLGS